jgi:spore germination protein YaaH
VFRFMMRALAIVTIFVAACSGGSGPSSPSGDQPPPAPPPASPATSSNPAPSNNPAPSSNPAPSNPAPSNPAPSNPAPSTDPAANPTASNPTTPSAPGVRAHADHAHCGWIGADTAEAGTASFVANADWFDAIHPKWFTLNSDGTPRTIAFTDDATVTQTARAHNVKLMPLIDADTVDLVQKAMSNPSAHAQAVAALVVQHGYDGIELDYEHLWSKTYRPGFTALIQAVATALHAQGKQLSLALPALWQDGDNGYDYVALQQAADVIHLMGYDYHWLGGPHLGPIAPKGWIENVLARVESLGAPQKYILGVANYAIGSGWYTTAADAVSLCGANYSRETNHMATCDLGNHEEAGLAPHCTSSRGEVWFEDAASVAEKAGLAKNHHLRGVTYWTVGAEPAGFFDGITAQFQ